MTIVQYIFLRSDLKGFSKGAMMAQACHSTVKAIEAFKNENDTISYLSNIDNMHKIILKINENDIEELTKTLEENNIDYIKWIEQPENLLTSIALRPYEKEDLTIPLFKKYKLW